MTEGPSSESVMLRLYIAGMTASAQTALANIRRICDEHLEGRYSLEVVDLLERPALAEGDQIFAVPTLVRLLPPPLRKFIGDLSDTAKVLVGLEIRPLPEADGGEAAPGAAHLPE